MNIFEVMASVEKLFKPPVGVS